MRPQNVILEPPRDRSSVTDSSQSPVAVWTRRILVAEDDDCLRRFMSMGLSCNGFTVQGASDGEQAWEALLHQHYDLLVTDNEMPRLTGIDLIKRIRKEDMRLPVIVASGTFPSESADSIVQLKIAAVLPKPFTILELRDAVRNVLASCDGVMGPIKYPSLIPGRAD